MRQKFIPAYDAVKSFSGVTSNATAAGGAFYQNCVLRKAQNELKPDEEDYLIFPRYGWALASAIGSGPTSPKAYGGFYYWNNNLYAVIVGTDHTRIYKYNISGAAWGEITSGGNRSALTWSASSDLVRASFAELRTGTYQLIIHIVKNGHTDSPTSELWVWDDTTLTKVTDADYPTNCIPGVVVIDGYTVVATKERRIYNSDLNAPTAWTSSSYITSTYGASPGKAIGKYLNYIAFFSEYDTTFFYNAGLTGGSPFASVEGTEKNFGCYTGYSLIQADVTIYFVAKTQHQLPFIARLESGDVKKLSRDSFNTNLTSVNANFYCYSFTDTLSPDFCYAIHGLDGIGGNTYVVQLEPFFVSTMTWSHYDCSIGTVVSAGIRAPKVYLLGSTGDLRTLAASSDDGTDVTVIIQPPSAEFNTSANKFLRSVTLKTHKPYSSYGGTWNFKTSKDQWTSEKNHGNITSGSKAIIRWTGLGSFTKQQFRLTSTSASIDQGVGILGFECIYDQGSLGVYP